MPASSPAAWRSSPRLPRRLSIPGRLGHIAANSQHCPSRLRRSQGAATRDRRGGRANTGGSVDVPSGAAGDKVPIELLGLLKGKESRCGATAALMRAIDMLRDMLPGTPDPLGVRFSSAGIFGLVKQETLPCHCPLRRQPPRARIAPTLAIHIHRQQRAVRPDPGSAAAPRCEPQRNPQGLSPIGPEAGRRFATDLYGLWRGVRENSLD